MSTIVASTWYSPGAPSPVTITQSSSSARATVATRSRVPRSMVLVQLNDPGADPTVNPRRSTSALSAGTSGCLPEKLTVISPAEPLLTLIRVVGWLPAASPTYSRYKPESVQYLSRAAAICSTRVLLAREGCLLARGVSVAWGAAGGLASPMPWVDGGVDSPVGWGSGGLCSPPS